MVGLGSFMKRILTPLVGQADKNWSKWVLPKVRD